MEKTSFYIFLYILLVLFSVLYATGCSSPIQSSPPASPPAIIPTKIMTMTIAPTAINTLLPTSTATPTTLPTATRNPSIPERIPENGDHMKAWGWEGLQIWASNIPLVSCRNGRGTDFVCGDNPDINIFFWDSENPWYFAGQASIGKMQTFSFIFDTKYKNIVITANNQKTFAIDSIVGLLENGQEIPFGYALGKDNLTLVPNQLYWDTPNTPIDIEFFLSNEKKNIHPASIVDCGIVGKEPDNNVSIVRPGAGGEDGTGDVILFRLISDPDITGGFRGEQAYDLKGVEITFGEIEPEQKHCPMQ